MQEDYTLRTDLSARSGSELCKCKLFLGRFALPLESTVEVYLVSQPKTESSLFVK
jgi:hypothetical protein